MNIFGVEKTNCAVVDCSRLNVHLILWAEGSDANTFHHAATVLEKDYKKHYPNHKVVVESFAHGRDFVDIINIQNDNSIASLDVASHGNMFGVHISQKGIKVPAPEHHLYWHPALRHKSMQAVHGKNPQTVDDAVYMEEQMLGLYKDEDGLEWAAVFFNQNKCMESSPKLPINNIENAKSFFNLLNNANAIEVITAIVKQNGLPSEGCETGIHKSIRFISDINKNKFKKETYIEFHGCRIGEELPVISNLIDNFAEELAEYLSGSPTVVAHIENNNPNNSKNGNQNDYRHNKVRVYTQTWWSLGWNAASDDLVERWGLEIPNSSTPPALSLK